MIRLVLDNLTFRLRQWWARPVSRLERLRRIGA
jgi:hypothetical protein